jgi:hypothetical protein
MEFESINTSMFLESLETIDPGLALIKAYLDRFNVSPYLIPVYIEFLGRINENGFGDIITKIRDHRVVSCEGLDTRSINIDIKPEQGYN